MKFLLVLVLLTLPVLGDETETKDSIEVEQMLCSQTASALRVQLRALQILQDHQNQDNKEAIDYLEMQASLYGQTIDIYKERPACQTRNVKTVIIEKKAYWDKYKKDTNFIDSK